MCDKCSLDGICPCGQRIGSTAVWTAFLGRSASHKSYYVDLVLNWHHPIDLSAMLKVFSEWMLSGLTGHWPLNTEHYWAAKALVMWLSIETFIYFIVTYGLLAIALNSTDSNHSVSAGHGTSLHLSLYHSRSWCSHFSCDIQEIGNWWGSPNH